MTRKDYELIAEVIRNADEVASFDSREAIAENLASALQRENYRFDRARFLTACGVK